MDILRFCYNLHIELLHVYEHALFCLEKSDWQRLGALMTQGHQCLQQLGVSTTLLDRIVDHCITQPTVYGAKLSGSGFGDCVIGIGTIDHTLLMQAVPEARVIDATLHTQEAAL